MYDQHKHTSTQAHSAIIYSFTQDKIALLIHELTGYIRKHSNIRHAILMLNTLLFYVELFCSKYSIWCNYISSN